MSTQTPEFTKLLHEVENTKDLDTETVLNYLHMAYAMGEKAQIIEAMKRLS